MHDRAITSSAFCRRGEIHDGIQTSKRKFSIDMNALTGNSCCQSDSVLTNRVDLNAFALHKYFINLHNPTICYTFVVEFDFVRMIKW